MPYCQQPGAGCDNCRFDAVRGRNEPPVIARQAVQVLVWAAVGVAKAAALVWLITDADRLWPQSLAALLVAFALVALALLLRRADSR